MEAMSMGPHIWTAFRIPDCMATCANAPYAFCVCCTHASSSFHIDFFFITSPLFTSMVVESENPIATAPPP